LRKIASGADEFSSLREYVQVLVSIFDQNQDGYISFNELTEGLKQFKINLTAQEKQGIMRKLDFNKDGEISEEEIFRAL
jgi:Ca2+-binding EF-hand superfamily protein